MSKKNRAELTLGFREVISDLETLSKVGLLELAWKLLALGLVIWLGAKIVGLIISAMAFIAFTVFVLGAVMIAVEASIAIFNWLMEKTGWEEADIKAFFEKVIIELEHSCEEVTVFIQSQ